VLALTVTACDIIGALAKVRCFRFEIQQTVGDLNEAAGAAADGRRGDS
jgi:hypothetical protein